MKKWIYLLLMILISSISNFLTAQQLDTIRQWNINDCFKYAATHNIEINTLRLNERYALQNLLAAKGLKIPSLDASIGNTFNNANNDAVGNGNLTNQLSSTGNYSLNSAIVLWNGNFINNNIQQNNIQLQSAGLSVKQSVNTIVLTIAQAYLNILLAKENLQYIADLAATSDSLVRQGQLFYDAGSVAQINLLQLQAQFASDKYLLVQTQNAVRQNTLALKQLLQLPSDSLFDIISLNQTSIVDNLPSLYTVQQMALQDFPDMKIGQLGIDNAQLDIAKAKAGFMPILSANAAIGSGYNDVLTNANYPKTNYFTQSDNNFYQRFGITIAIPIFSNYVNKTNLEKANINLRQSALNLQNYQLVLTQAIEQVYLNAVNARQAYASANEQLLAATESFRIIKEQFKLGGTNTFEVLQLRNQFVQAVQAYTQSKYTAVLQQKIYEFYLGQAITL